MRRRVKLFEEDNAIGGYSIAVRDDWSFKIKRLHVSEDEKLAYEQEFGNKIIHENEFLNWLLAKKQASF